MTSLFHSFRLCLLFAVQLMTPPPSSLLKRLQELILDNGTEKPLRKLALVSLSNVSARVDCHSLLLHSCPLLINKIFDLCSQGDTEQKRMLSFLLSNLSSQQSAANRSHTRNRSGSFEFTERSGSPPADVSAGLGGTSSGGGGASSPKAGSSFTFSSEAPASPGKKGQSSSSLQAALSALNLTRIDMLLGSDDVPTKLTAVYTIEGLARDEVSRCLVASCWLSCCFRCRNALGSSCLWTR